MDAFLPDAIVLLLEELFWRLYWHQLHRRHLSKKFVTIVVSGSTKSVKTRPHAVKPRLAGSTAISFTSWSVTAVTYSTSHSHRAILMTVSQSKTYWVYWAEKSLLIGAMSRKKLAEKLLETFNIEFFAKPRRNMHNKLMRLTDKLLTRKRSIVETVIDQLKNISQIEHSRHRSPVNCWVNIICGLIAYCHQPKKPALHLDWALPPAA